STALANLSNTPTDVAQSIHPSVILFPYTTARPAARSCRPPTRARASIPRPPFVPLPDFVLAARLMLRPLAAVAVAHVDHPRRPQARADDRGANARDAGRVEVRCFTAAPNDVADVIAGRRRDCAAALLGHGQKVVRMRSRLHGVDRDLH